jgi:hypothetical protein
MVNIKKNRTVKIKGRCSSKLKASLSRKLIACGYIYRKDTEVLCNFAEFLEDLDSKDLEWFQENFTNQDGSSIS